MKVGDTVTIYEDPKTETKPECKAKLVELLLDDIEPKSGLQFWTVEIDGVQYERWIKTPKGENQHV